MIIHKFYLKNQMLLKGQYIKKKKKKKNTLRFSFFNLCFYAVFLNKIFLIFLREKEIIEFRKFRQKNYEVIRQARVKKKKKRLLGEIKNFLLYIVIYIEISY